MKSGEWAIIDSRNQICFEMQFVKVWWILIVKVEFGKRKTFNIWRLESVWKYKPLDVCNVRVKYSLSTDFSKAK